MKPNRPHSEIYALRLLIEAMDSHEVIKTEQFEREASKIDTTSETIRRRLLSANFFKIPEWNWKDSRWTYFVEGYKLQISFSASRTEVVLKSILRAPPKSRLSVLIVRRKQFSYS
jgi:hypothetical protein